VCLGILLVDPETEDLVSSVRGSLSSSDLIFRKKSGRLKKKKLNGDNEE